VGTTRAVQVDLRVVSATHRPLETLVASGAFRADLLARLDGFTFALPPLRERREDTGMFVADLLRTTASGNVQLSPEVGRALLRYDWPLNVRELGHCLARACALAKGQDRIELEHLPPQVRAALESRTEASEPAGEASDARLRAQLEGLLEQHHGNLAEVSRALGKARMQVHRWVKRFGIDIGRYRQ
jgi:transcriptional regulator of acetoin/glycerol metabolism